MNEQEIKKRNEIENQKDIELEIQDENGLEGQEKTPKTKNDCTVQIRTSHAIAERFAYLHDKLHLKSGPFLERLVNMCEREIIGEGLSDQKENIAQFQRYLDALGTMYLSAVQSIESQRTLAEQRVQNQLKSKDSIIQELQGKLANATKKAEEFASLQKAYESTCLELKSIKDQMASLEKINDSLRLQVLDAAEIQGLKDQIAELKLELAVKDTKLSSQCEMIELLKKSGN